VSSFILRRLAQTLLLLFLLSIVLFALVNLAPGGPLVGLGQNRRVRPEQLEIMRRQFGLDQPLPTQYLVWLVGNDWMKIDSDGDGLPDQSGLRRGVLRGDFGISYNSRQPVLVEISQRLPNTIYLMGITILVAILIAIPIGIISATRQYSRVDIALTTFSFAGQALPEFWLGLVLIIVFYSWLRNPLTGDSLFPAGGMYSLETTFSISDRIWHLVLPVATGALGWVSWYSRFVRASLLDVIHADYLRTARAKGLPEKLVLYKHALRTALVPLVTMLALDLPTIFSGAIFVELLFAWPGMGRLYYQAAAARDYPVLMAVLMIGAAFIILSNLLADVVYAYLDPRVRYE
jgi:peptide/nickel transport system permease protein